MSRLVTIAALAAGLSGCLGTETGNPPFAPSVAGESGGQMGIVPRPRLEAGWLALSELTFVPCEGDGIVVRYEPGALALHGAQRLEADPVLEPGDYCGVRFERVAWSGAEPSALAGRSLAIDASLADSTVHVRSTRTGPLELTGEPFAMSEAGGSLVLFLDESLLFSGLSFADAERDADGSVVVSAETNADLLERIEAQLPGALSLYRDVDGDGALSEEELAAGPLATVPAP